MSMGTFLEYMREHGGWGDLPPITVDEAGNVIDGMKRCRAAEAFGLEDVPSREVKGVLTNEQRLALRIELNHRNPILMDEVGTWLGAHD